MRLVSGSNRISVQSLLTDVTTEKTTDASLNHEQESSGDSAKKRQKVQSSALPNFEQLNSSQPSSYLSSVVLYFPPHQQVEAVSAETDHVVERKTRTDMLEHTLAQFDLKPESGWGTSGGTWQKGSKNDLEAALKPQATEELKDRILSAMTLLISPKNTRYVLVNKSIQTIRKERLSETNNASLKSNYKIIDWSVSSTHSEEAEWINESITKFCLPSILKWYDETYPYNRGETNLSLAKRSLTGSFACYMKKRVIEPVKNPMIHPLD